MTNVSPFQEHGLQSGLYCLPSRSDGCNGLSYQSTLRSAHGEMKGMEIIKENVLLQASTAHGKQGIMFAHTLDLLVIFIIISSTMVVHTVRNMLIISN